MGKHYDPGAKLLKAEKAQNESDAKVKKLRTSDTKEDQNKEKADASTTAMDTEMPELISEDEDTPSQKKFTTKKPPL